MPAPTPESKAINEAMHAAKLALLENIAERAPKATPVQILRLAEAYAWLFAPGESHGGGPSE